MATLYIFPLLSHTHLSHVYHTRFKKAIFFTSGRLLLQRSRDGSGRVGATRGRGKAHTEPHVSILAIQPSRRTSSQLTNSHAGSLCHNPLPPIAQRRLYVLTVDRASKAGRQPRPCNARDLPGEMYTPRGNNIIAGGRMPEPSPNPS